MTCLNCSAPLRPADDDGWRECPAGCGSFYLQGDEAFTHDLDRDYLIELADEAAEDKALLVDYRAVKGGGRVRGMGR